MINRTASVSLWGAPFLRLVDHPRLLPYLIDYPEATEQQKRLMAPPSVEDHARVVISDDNN